MLGLRESLGGTGVDPMDGVRGAERDLQVRLAGWGSLAGGNQRIKIHSNPGSAEESADSNKKNEGKWPGPQQADAFD
jgi:hypothetical protein